MPRVVTLTTDFGSGSGYVAEMKGRLLHARAQFTLVDIAHDVSPHDIRAAAWLVGQACPAFPVGTLHIVVVDPGVGTARRLLWARVGEQEFLCPDNGVLSGALARAPLEAARVLADVSPAAATFHGRDVLAPAAVRLLDGTAPESLGPPATDPVSLAWPEPQETAAGLVGEVIHVDAFGNLITNLPAASLARLVRSGRIRLGEQERHEIGTIVRTYGDAQAGTPVVLVGSQGYLEIAVVEARADTRFAAGIGTVVSIA
jgi:S-adenosylmethionine hydrolase